MSHASIPFRLAAAWASAISLAPAADRFPLYWIAPPGESLRAPGGDVNGDGMADLVLVSTAPISSTYPQVATVRSGVDGSVLHSWTPSDPNLWAFQGNSGWKPAGDLDNDGFGDIALSIVSPVLPVGVVEVRSGLDASVMAVIGPPGVSNSAFIGGGIAGVGDLDGDGWAELMVRGDHLTPGCSIGTGVYDFEGPGLGLQFYLTSWQCGQGFGSFGRLDDVDGDGLPDFYVGAPFTDLGGIQDAGWIGIFSGVMGSLITSMSGTAAFEYLGGSVAPLSDLNGDGKPELAVPGLGGQIHIAVLSLPSFSVLYLIPGGGEIDAMGDIDGDGFDDYLVRESTWPPPYSEVIRAISGPTGAVLGSIGQSIPGSLLYPWGALRDVNGDGLGDFAASPAVVPWVNLPPLAAQSLWTPWSWPVGAGLQSLAHVYVSRNFDLAGPAAVGGAAQFEVVAPKRAGKPFQVVLSQDFVFPGIPLGPFLFPLATDALFWTSLSAAIGGTLDATGHGTVSVPIPNDPSLQGWVFQASGVVYDPAGPLGIGCVLTQLPVPIQ